MTTSLRSAGLAVSLVLILAPLAGCSGDPDQTASAKATASAGVSTGTTAQSATKLVQTGIAQAQSGDLDAAATTFSNALVLDSANKYALYNLGLIAQTQKRTAAAIRYYDAAMASDPAYTPAMYNKAILLEASDLAGAAALYQRIIAINPQASTAYLRLGFADSDLGRDADAKAARTKALELDPTLADVPAPDRG